MQYYWQFFGGLTAVAPKLNSWLFQHYVQQNFATLLVAVSLYLKRKMWFMQDKAPPSECRRLRSNFSKSSNSLKYPIWSKATEEHILRIKNSRKYSKSMPTKWNQTVSLTCFSTALRFGRFSTLSFRNTSLISSSSGNTDSCFFFRL